MFPVAVRLSELRPQSSKTGGRRRAPQPLQRNRGSGVPGEIVLTAPRLRTGQREAMEGGLVQRMVTHGVEVMAGMVQDPSFGPLIGFGLGGIHLSGFLGDVRFRIAPLTELDAADLIRSIRAIACYRGIAAIRRASVDAIQDLLLGLSRLVEEVPECGARSESRFSPCRQASGLSDRRCTDQGGTENRPVNIQAEQGDIIRRPYAVRHLNRAPRKTMIQPHRSRQTSVSLRSCGLHSRRWTTAVSSRRRPIPAPRAHMRHDVPPGRNGSCIWPARCR